MRDISIKEITNMKYTFAPVIDIRELEKALESQYDIDTDDLRSVLFGDYYSNDCFKKYYFRSKWESEDEEPIEVCVINQLLMV